MTGSVRPELHEDEPTHLLRIGLLLAVAVTGLLSAAVVGLPREHSGLPPIARQALTEALPRWETTEPVSEIVYGTRAFDTFGETFLLIAAVVSVMMLTRSREPRDGYIGEEDVGKQEQREEDPHLLGVASIAGVPPLNGYASLGMIHDALRSHPGTFAAVLLAQVITIAALGRAAYLAFFRRRDDDYDPLERMRPGMLVAFCSLGAGCVAFGVMPGFVLTHVADPAAAGLTSPSVYSSAALSGAAHVSSWGCCSRGGTYGATTTRRRSLG